MDFNSPEIYEAIANNENIIVAAHTAPDGDAVGSTAAMVLALRMLGKKPDVYIEKFTHKLDYLKGLDEIITKLPEGKTYDLFIALDCGSKDRLGAALPLFEAAKHTMVIDHHISNEDFGEMNIVYPKASSTCEVVYEMLKNFCVINKDIAEAIYSGILTDTNGFMNSCTLPRTHEIAAVLLKTGISTPDIHSKLLYSHSFTEMKICGYAYSKAKLENSICHCTLSKEEITEKCGADYTEIDSIVGYLVNCSGAKLSVLVYEKEDGCIKLSMRSKEADISKVAVKYGGGGHMLAAGVNFYDKTIEEVETLILKELGELVK